MVPTAFKADGSDQDGYEFAEEARMAEPLKLPESLVVSHSISSEFARLCRQPIDGLYVVPSASNLFEWFGILFIRRGVFGGGIFRFDLLIPSKYPNITELPAVRFHLPLFHPHIDAERRVDMRRYFPEGWKRDKHHLHNVLLVTQRIFFSYECEPSSCANPEAALLWKEQPEKFKQMAKESVNLSRAQVYDEPPDEDQNAIRLTPWDTTMHESVREKMKSSCGLGSGGAGVWCGVTSAARGGSGLEMLDGRRWTHTLSWIDTDAMTYMNEAVKLDADVRAEHTRLVHGIERLDLSGVQGEDDENVHLQSTKPHIDNNDTTNRTDLSLSSGDSLTHESISTRHEKLSRPVGEELHRSENEDSEPRLHLETHDGEESDV